MRESESILDKRARERSEEKKAHTKKMLEAFNVENSTYKERSKANGSILPPIISSYQNGIFEEISPNKSQGQGNYKDGHFALLPTSCDLEKDAIPNPYPRESFCTKLSKAIGRLFC